MVYGDLASIWGKNTSYFHKVANHKAKTNFMHGILDAQNHLQYDYQKMTQRALNLDFIRDKVEATLQSMAPTKSLGPDGMLRRGKAGSRKLVLKLDMAKAYDRGHPYGKIIPSKDDSLLFCDAEPLQVTELKRIFRIYEEASG
ncbi:Hypothetical predicted protein [Prunus dulcis]|uniref:Uncharacterized protein n=1 Tax=Prunus dulcis TaxID=3755 RepID=A0A5E4GP95_PRUDU|nr:Hypothetical predicted protein [Prunus dulcis]